MPTPRIKPGHPRWEQACAAHQRRNNGDRIGDIANEWGKDWKTIERWINAVERYERASPGQLSAVEATGLDLATAKHGWRIVQHEDGSRDSVFWKAEDIDPQDMLDALKDAVSTIPKVRPVSPPQGVDDDLLTLIPVADLHAGMMAWGRETGEDYNTKIATTRLTEWVGNVVSRSPKSGVGVILFNGDTLHANDQTNATPRSKHALDVDTRHFKTIEMLVHAIGVAVDQALLHFGTVFLVVKPGNHDRDGYLAILFALAERYRNEPRVEVDKDPSEFWAYQFGKVMLASHHGDKGRAQQMVLFIADQYPEIWGATRWRFLWTGHLHHHKSQDIGGVQWEQSRAVTSRDAYAAGHGYSARSELQAVTYHRERGEVSRVKVTE